MGSITNPRNVTLSNVNTTLKKVKPPKWSVENPNPEWDLTTTNGILHAIQGGLSPGEASELLDQLKTPRKPRSFSLDISASGKSVLIWGGRGPFQTNLNRKEIEWVLANPDVLRTWLAKLPPNEK